MSNSNSNASTMTLERTRPAPARVDRMPPWKVLLHNDDVNEMESVVETIVELTPLKEQEALLCMIEAHKTGVALLLATHREHAELLQEQFASKRLTVTIEPDR
jgi:ATP-dependent Clp protease adaptor protein ClpS